jgi:type II secretory pathway pseudopilin PulG
MIQQLPHHRLDIGFSLIETLVAVAILLLVIVGPMSIASQANSSTTFANQQITAYFLAQEGLELAQKGRDDLLLPQFAAYPLPPANNVGWNAFVSDVGDFSECIDGNTCGLEIIDGADGDIDVRDCSNFSDCRLYLSNDAGRSHYTYDDSVANVATDFTRTVTMDVDGDEVFVTATVRWRTGDQITEQSTTATTYLFNVYGR